MRIRTFLQYLIGRRQAILNIAADRQALRVGFLFVIAAAFAREYDGEDLLHEPWYLLIPLGISLLSSFVLFVMTYGVAKLKNAPGPGFLPAYLSFLGLYWMTAPLAFLYAIPYERFLTPLDATYANLWTLAVVSLWRVFLMMRVVGVLMGYGWSAIFLVMTFADVVVLIAVQSSAHLFFISTMGGLRLSPSEQLLGSMACFFCNVGWLSLPVWSIGALVVWAKSKPAWQQDAATAEPAGRGMQFLALASLAIWIVILPVTQPVQILRRHVEREMQQGRISSALTLMSAHSREDFPRHWTPPQPPLLDVLEVIVGDPPSPWVQVIYVEKFEGFLQNRYLDPVEVIRVVGLLRRLPEGAALLGRLKEMSRRENSYSYGLKHNLEEIDKAWGNCDE